MNIYKYNNIINFSSFIIYKYFHFCKCTRFLDKNLIIAFNYNNGYYKLKN